MLDTMLAMLALLVATPDFDGLDPPELETSWVTGKSETTDGDVRVTCRAYATFALVETNDPGLRGAADFTLRDRAPGTKAADVCARSFAGASRKVALQDRYVTGAKGAFVPFTGGDSFGSEHALTVVDARDGRTLLQTVRVLGKPARLSSSIDGRVSLELFVALDVPCDLAGSPACWQEVRRKNKVPADVALTFDLKRCGAKPAGALQVGVAARIDDLAKPSVVFLGGDVPCAQSP